MPEKLSPCIICLKKKTVQCNFDEDCNRAFSILKKELTAYPVLRLYNPAAETELHTDASSQGFAAILLQKNNNKRTPVAYFSQCTNKAESNYRIFELEMMAIVKAVERFHTYLYGLEFTVVTDCNSVVYAVNKANLNSRIARWILHLQNYRFKLKHISGNRMSHVDALGRHIGYVRSLPVKRELDFKQLQDAKLKSMAENLEYKDNNKFKLIEGLVYKKDKDRSRFVIPDMMITNIIRASSFATI